jgi:hypothetical protein
LGDFTGTTIPKEPTIVEGGEILDSGEIKDDRDTIGRWWIEGPVGATGASISADPSEVTGVHMTGELANRLTVHFTAGDLPGRYAVVFDEVPLVIDVTE